MFSMNRIKSILVALAAVVMVSCVNETPVVKYLEVTPNNLAGQWELVEWSGAELDADSYFYIDLVRKERKFTIYQNFDSMSDYPHVVTGEFNIEMDVELGAIIRGIYDYDEGFWAHEYEINNLTESSMEWVATDDPSFVQKFKRIPSIPENLKD